MDKVKRSPERTRLLLRSYARNISQQVSYSTIRKDMLSNDASTLDEDTVANYIKALKKLFVIEDLAAWNPNIRSMFVTITSYDDMVQSKGYSYAHEHFENSKPKEKPGK